MPMSKEMEKLIKLAGIGEAVVKLIQEEGILVAPRKRGAKPGSRKKRGRRKEGETPAPAVTSGVGSDPGEVGGED